MSDPRRALPSVNALLTSDALRPLVERAPRALVTDAIRGAVEAARRDPASAPHDLAGWAEEVARELARRERPSLRPVINATGVVLHTNLGRAPLAPAALEAIRAAAEGYCNLEYDIERGARGSRHAHCVSLLRELTGAEDALVVNNGAAALVLALNTLATAPDGSPRDAVISRGELVEIGGSFRVPDIMAKSGARLVEVGTTNRTHLDDYRRAIGAETGALVKVHRSNFAIEGFVADVALRELAALAAEHALPVVHDLGSGLLIPLDEIGLHGEPVAADAVRAGATVVTMSGDKLLGGPQAGIIVGAAGAVARIRANPLTRAFRVDKLTLAALEATLALYRDPARALREVPVLAMLGAPVAGVRARAERLRERLGRGGIAARVVESEGSVGGGAFPVARIPSAALALEGDAAALEASLRAGDPPVIGRIAEGRLLLDLRSVPPADDERLAAAVAEAFR
ncbi:MAG TPA: L-seryl-tRNA(Sec) selenium transferase [Gemmatimonadaceae bacterium]|nr:L-seryl-tRNA(Sec) selenium transferase [Gemmatimonadaceae bacterium]